LRYSLQEFSHSDFALVRGKELWRITNAREKSNVFFKLRDKEKVLELSLRVLALVERFVQGEERNETLFNEIHGALTFFQETEMTDADATHAEYIFTLKILHDLGYGTESKKLRHFIESPWSRGLLEEMKASSTEAKDHIGRSMRESHL
jgi:recombinational DNA repair protein (RecF pathway)